MKGTPEVIASLNELISERHSCFIFFMLMGATCNKWGYEETGEYFSHLSKEEVEVINKILKRILFLDGNATLDNLDNTFSVESVAEMLLFSKNTKMLSVSSLSDAIEVATTFKDFGTRIMLEHMLVEEDKHLANIEARMIQYEERGTL